VLLPRERHDRPWFRGVVHVGSTAVTRARSIQLLPILASTRVLPAFLAFDQVSQFAQLLRREVLDVRGIRQ
jgi:hypothetical protein